ncbi:DUF3833 domain-containing protein [Vibrio ostreicida]|uniref:DUF3833 domain-containing protein n=1 Tax=Vibrio ostreicida TaxID=526588 RepID=A0ABT8BU56_9VIBR|nr:DUF3833 domain-containing protein [Vibrio ostreicida]MDN3609680.1 DUF3833 domain-containing protein [Vibrio ostreicida]NPD09488.1 DUF3833 domain-containing protein [Vibrio ostreicida]
MKQWVSVVWLFIAVIVSGCSADVKDYKQTSPTFNLFDYFQGDVTAWGMIQDYTGKQTRRFEVTINGTVEGNTLRLVEDFVFDDGEIDQRIWLIEKGISGLYQGKADDIVGVAKGQEVGNVLHWQYDFTLNVNGSEVEVTFDDWLYRQDDKHVFNLTSIRKLGVEVGKITLFFQKH